MNMKFISSKAHGVFDYIAGVLLIVLPLVLLPSQAPVIAVIMPVIVGVLVILMALFTNFELGLVHKIGMANHLMIDNGLGVLLAITPWIFGFFQITYGLHLIAGIVIFTFGMFTNSLTTTGQYDTKEPGEITRDYLNQK
jgi:hypothetical protein